MTNYTCEKCEYTTDHKGDFTKHLNKKKPCVSKNKTIVIAPVTKTDSSNNYIDNSFNYIVNNTIKPNDELLEEYKLELEKIKTENEFLKSDNNKLKIENELLKNEIVDLKNERKELFNMIKSNQTIQPAQQPQQPQVIQIVQPTPPPEPETKQTKELNRKDKPAHYKELHKDCIELEKFIESIEITPKEAYSVCLSSGSDGKRQFINGVSKLLVKHLNSIQNDTDQPIFCSDLKRRTVYFKHKDTEPKYIKASYNYDNLCQKYKDEINNGDIDVNELEQDEWGEQYFIEELDETYTPGIKWIKESEEYPIFKKYLSVFEKKIRQLGFGDYKETPLTNYLLTINKDGSTEKNDFNSCKEVYLKFVNIMTSFSYIEDMPDFMECFCKSIYVD